MALVSRWKRTGVEIMRLGSEAPVSKRVYYLPVWNQAEIHSSCNWAHWVFFFYACRLTGHIIYSRGNTPRWKEAKCFISTWNVCAFPQDRLSKPLHSCVSPVRQAWPPARRTLRSRHCTFQTPSRASSCCQVNPAQLPVSLREWQSIPCAALIGRTCVADGDKTGVLLFAAVLRALQCCHSARQDGDAIESCPLITTMQNTVGQLIRNSPSSWFVYLFTDIFEMTAILKVQGDVWGAHFNMSISITLPWQPWDRLALWASCQSSLLSLYWICSHKDSAVLCAADVWA